MSALYLIMALIAWEWVQNHRRNKEAKKQGDKKILHSWHEMEET